MSIKVNSEKCIACGKCTNICPGNLLYRDEKNKAYIKYKDMCWGCTACLKECPVGAITYFLGADIGGSGTTMYTKKEKNLLHWHIKKTDGEEIKITTSEDESNKY